MLCYVVPGLSIRGIKMSERWFKLDIRNHTTLYIYHDIYMYIFIIYLGKIIDYYNYNFITVSK